MLKIHEWRALAEQLLFRLLCLIILSAPVWYLGGCEPLRPWDSEPCVGWLAGELRQITGHCSRGSGQGWTRAVISCNSLRPWFAADDLIRRAADRSPRLQPPISQTQVWPAPWANTPLECLPVKHLFCLNERVEPYFRLPTNLWFSLHSRCGGTGGDW